MIQYGQVNKNLTLCNTDVCRFEMKGKLNARVVARRLQLPVNINSVLIVQHVEDMTLKLAMMKIAE